MKTGQLAARQQVSWRNIPWLLKKEPKR